MAQEHINTIMVLYIKELGLMVSNMVWELKHALTDRLLLGHIAKDINMVRENFYGKTVPHLKENLKMTIWKDMESTNGLMDADMMAIM